MALPRVNIASTRLAFFLIALVTLQIFVSAIVPQRDLAVGQVIGWRSTFQDHPLVDRLWLDRIYFSPVFLASLSLLGINLLAGNVRRFRTVWRVDRNLLKARHLGSIVFHLALLIVITGVLLNNLYRFSGVYGMTEGQEVGDEESYYMRQSKGLLRGDRSGRFRLRLERVDRFHEVGDAVTEEALVRLNPSDGGLPHAAGIRINQPLKWRDLEIHLGGVTGYSPELVILDDNNQAVFRSFIRLKATRTLDSIQHEDFIMLQDGTLSLNVRVVPEPGDPQVFGRWLTVTRNDSTLFSGELAVADTVVAGDMRIAIPRMRNWCYLHVMGNPLLWLVFSGFWLGLAGMAITVVARVIPGRERQT